MQTYISILRGINVGGKNMIKMADLKKAFEGEGFKDVHIYIQSGNIVFMDRDKNEKELTKKIVTIISDHFNLKVPVIIRNSGDWVAVAQNNPFLKMTDIDTTKLHVTFLSEDPEQDKVEKIKDLIFEPDQFIISGKTIYLYIPGGYGNTKINNTFFENKLKVSATTRNWRTVNELQRMAADLANKK